MPPTSLPTFIIEFDRCRLKPSRQAEGKSPDVFFMLAEKMISKAAEEGLVTAQALRLHILLLHTQGNRQIEILRLLKEDQGMLSEAQVGVADVCFAYLCLFMFFFLPALLPLALWADAKTPLLPPGRERNLEMLRWSCWLQLENVAAPLTDAKFNLHHLSHPVPHTQMCQ